MFVTGASASRSPIILSFSIAHRPRPRTVRWQGTEFCVRCGCPVFANSATRRSRQCCALPASSPPFQGRFGAFSRPIRDPCPPANAETPDQDPRRLIPRSISLHLHTSNFHHSRSIACLQPPYPPAAPRLHGQPTFSSHTRHPLHNLLSRPPFGPPGRLRRCLSPFGPGSKIPPQKWHPTTTTTKNLIPTPATTPATRARLLPSPRPLPRPPPRTARSPISLPGTARHSSTSSRA